MSSVGRQFIMASSIRYDPRAPCFIGRGPSIRQVDPGWRHSVIAARELRVTVAHQRPLKARWWSEEERLPAPGAHSRRRLTPLGGSRPSKADSPLFTPRTSGLR